jgi:acyl-CoA dehydrogenase
MEANGLAIAPLLVSASHELKQKYLEPMTRPLKQGEKPIIASYWFVSIVAFFFVSRF